MKKTKTFQNRGSPNWSYWHGVNSLENLATNFSTEGQKIFSPTVRNEGRKGLFSIKLFQKSRRCSFDILAE